MTWQLRRVRVALAAWRFRHARADYYDYLADLMDASNGRKTLRDIFVDDALRYKRHPRGVLSAYWALRYQDGGGDLHETFRATLPGQDLVLIRMAQRGGAGALGQILRDVAAMTRLVDQARRTLLGTLAVAFVAVLVATAMAVAVPLFTVPRLRHAFGMVPPDMLGRLTRGLFGFAEFVGQHAFTMAVALALAGYLIAWSMPNLTGRARMLIDRCFLWRLYRDFQSIRFLAALAVMVKRRGNVTTALREALDMLMEGASAWTRWHLEQMLGHIDDGRVGGATFDTGLIDAETLWFLNDLVAARGMDAALQQSRLRLEATVARQVASRANLMRWVLLLGAVGVALGLVFWHVGVVNEMRIALTNYYSSH